MDALSREGRLYKLIVRQTNITKFTFTCIDEITERNKRLVQMKVVGRGGDWGKGVLAFGHGFVCLYPLN